MTRRALVFLSLVGLAACSGEPSAPSNPVGPDLAISNAGNGSPDFFWRPPIKNGGGGTGTFNPNLDVTIKVCTTHNNTVCAIPVATFTDVPVVAGQYQADWTAPVSSQVDYRIFVIVEGTPDVVVGFADVKAASSQKALKAFNSNNFVLVTDGSNLPIKFRIEGHCTSTPCGETYIDLTEGGFAYARDGSGNVLAGIHISPGSGSGIVTATIEPCAGGADLPVDIPLFGDCWSVFTNPANVTLAVSGEIFICEAKPEIEALASEEQEEKVTIHRKHGTDPVQALRHDLEDCDGNQVMDDGSGPPVILGFKGLIRALAQGKFRVVGRQVLSLLGPTPLYARRYDAGAGGEIADGEGGGFSDFQFGLPSKMEQNFSEGISASAITIEVYVSDLGLDGENSGVPVANAKVHFAAAPGSGSVTPAVVLSDANGFASATWTLPEADGDYQASATGVGIADRVINGPRGGGYYCEGSTDCYFDPFMAIQSPFNPTGELETGAVTLGTGTVTFEASVCSECSVSGNVTGAFGVKQYGRILLPQPKTNGLRKPGAIKR